MDLLRQYEFFNPEKIEEEIHVIGIGAIGSHIVEMLVRMGVDEIDIYDFDNIDSHNIPNQMYYDTDIGESKCSALKKMCKAINPSVSINIHNKGYRMGMRLAGYVFLCLDSIDMRKMIVKEHMYNPMIRAIFDFRMGLTDAQHYAADWKNPKDKEKLWSTMQFTDEEAKAEMPVSACGSALCVLPTIRTITAYGIANWLNFVKTKKLNTCILANSFNFMNTVF